MSKPSLVIVVVEDDHHRMLIYRYLLYSGMKAHEIRVHRSPSGHGSADNWARKRFVEETKEYRRRQARARSALVVMIDADSSTVQHRFHQLDQALTQNGMPIVADGDKIARLVPKRNVETWILWLNETAVDEESDYKAIRSDWSQLIPAASEKLCTWVRSQAELPNTCIDSLRTGVRELERLSLWAV
jgi:hypothetical protein